MPTSIIETSLYVAYEAREIRVFPSANQEENFARYVEKSITRSKGAAIFGAKQEKQQIESQQEAIIFFIVIELTAKHLLQ